MRASKKLVSGIAALVIVAIAAGAVFGSSVIFSDDSEDGDNTATAFAATMHGTFLPFNADGPEDDTCFYLTGTPGDTVCNFVLTSTGSSTLLGATEETSSWKLAVAPLPGPGTIIGGTVTLAGEDGELHLVPVGPVPSLNIV